MNEKINCSLVKSDAKGTETLLGNIHFPLIESCQDHRPRIFIRPFELITLLSKASNILANSSKDPELGSATTAIEIENK